MAVYRRHYQPYAGQLTRRRSRFLVLPRYALTDLLGSRLLLAFLIFACLPILAEAVVIYVFHSPAARALLGIALDSSLDLVNANFFLNVLAWQCFYAFILAAWVGPGLIAPDLVNGALPLYLSRPLSRAEYVVGKATVLVTLLSVVTWVPCLLLFWLNSAFAEDGWGRSHLGIASALVVGGLTWIAVVTLLSLSLSAWIRWRLAASAMLFGVFFVSAGFGEAVAAVLRTSWGRIFSVGHLFEVVWAQLFGMPHSVKHVPRLAAWLGLVGVCIFSLAVLNHRLRAREVVR